MLDQNLVNLAKASQERGETKEQAYQALLAKGYSVQDITDAFDAAKAGGDHAETQKRTVSIVVTIGAILIGAGIFSYIASNWGDFGKPLKVYIILIAMLFSYALGWYAGEVRQLRKTGIALMLLGSVIYGSGIFLVAQIFNIRANWPDGFILWMLGVVLLAFTLDLSALLYFAAALGFIAVFGHPYSIYEALSGYNPILLTSTLLLTLTTVICFAVARHFRKKMPAEQNEIY